MSLNWNVSKVANSATLCFRIAEHDDPSEGISKGDKLLRPATQALIFATMATGLGDITAKNYREFFARLHFVEKLNGAYRRQQTAPGVHAPVFFTLADVRAHIGLNTNVFPAETRTKWQARMVENFTREALYKADQAERDAAKAA